MFVFVERCRRKIHDVTEMGGVPVQEPTRAVEKMRSSVQVDEAKAVHRGKQHIQIQMLVDFIEGGYASSFQITSSVKQSAALRKEWRGWGAGGFRRENYMM